MKLFKIFKALFYFIMSILVVACGSSEKDTTSKTTSTTAPYQLTIEFFNSPSLGSVNIQPENINCTINCSNDFTPNSVVELIATPNGNAQFSGWSGDCTGLSNCQMTINNNKKVTASFTIKPIEQFTLTIQNNNGGLIKLGDELLDCNTDCQFSFPSGKKITLAAQALENFIFDGWKGPCTGIEACSFFINENISVSALFSAITIPTKNNAITITEPHGKDQTNYPVQIGRPFIKGEILDFPQAVVNGSLITTQANVKQRYNDGSVKHAIISFILESLPANANKTISFVNQKNSNNTPLTKADMLSDDFEFDAKMVFSFPKEKIITAREILINDDFSYWLKGSLATTIILTDHSSKRIYDIGSDEFRSIRPIFHVTFWPTIKKYSVRYIAEAINTEYLQNQNYDLSLVIGNKNTTFYQQNNIPHQAMSRWTIKQWSGEQFMPLSISHNIHYLTATKAIPNFDTNHQISESVIEQDWTKWQQKGKNLYDKGWWEPVMAKAGGRPDIGLYPSWTVKWLFSGDWRLQEIVLKQSELASAWPMHLREGASNRKFDFSEKIDAIGHIVSMAPKARPTHWTARPDWHEVDESDKIIPVSPLTKTIWRPDKAHHPDIASPQYLLTGDYYFLEEMLFSAAFVSGDNNSKGFKSTLGRGPTGSEGGLYSGETRSQGWALRTRVHAYDIIPDEFPEKPYFHQLNQNAISMFEALMGVELSNNSNIDLYNFVRENVTKNEFKKTTTPSSIGQWDEGVKSASYVRADRVNINKVNQAIAPWMQNFVIIALGRANELGYDTDNLLAFAGQQLVQPFAIPEQPHAMMSAYIMPTLDNVDLWFNSWQEIYAQFTPEYIEAVKQYELTNQDSEHGYHGIAMAAASYLKKLEYHDELWLYIEQNIKSKTIFNNNPKWVLIPR